MSDEDDGDDGPTIGERLSGAWRQVSGEQVGLTLLGVIGVATIGTFGAMAYVIHGVIPAAAVVFAAAGGVIGPLLLLNVMKDDLPLSGVIATICRMLAQLTFRASALIRTEQGNWEWRKLRSDGAGLFAILDDGQRVDIDGDAGDLQRWSLGKIALVEQKGERNIGQFAVADTEPETRASRQIAPPKRQNRGSWLVSLKRIQTATRHSADSELTRNGREKALEEAGGTQQISELTVMLLSGALLVVGFGMTVISLSL